MSEMNNEFSFGQKEPLTVRLKGLIREYPKGVGIIKEFIQNADDAKASRIEIIMDWRVHQSDHLPSKGMKALMGPSLLIFNDQVFSDADLEGIQEIGLSVKIENSSKTGRFGLGFNASYNVTDFPSFLTRDRICFFDPHTNVVAYAKNDHPGHGWYLTEQTWSEFGDMFRPFSVFGLHESQVDFPGTVFRLPIRTEDHASRSEICQEPFTREDFYNIVQQLTELGPELLLFLKYVISIEVFEILPDGNDPHRLLQIITKNEAEVKQQRQIINKAVIENSKKMLQWLRSEFTTLPKVSYQHVIQLSAPDRQERQIWRITSGLFVDPGQEILSTMEAMLNLGEKAIPWAGVAALIERKLEDQHDNLKIKGKVYCFLPLGTLTSLPVHINGFFDLDSSRHQLTFNGSQVIGKDEVRVKWNNLLIEHCIARAYAELIVALVGDIGQSDPKAFYKYWPSVDQNLPGVLETLPVHVYGYPLKPRQV